MSTLFERHYQIEDEKRQQVTRIYEEGRKYSYELTQKLTYFVITAELVFCGYMLLNAEKVINLKWASWLFLSTSIAGFLGILWRFCYNITYHATFHEQTEMMAYRLANKAQATLHNMYVFFTILSFIWAAVAGFVYLQNYPSLQKSYELTPNAKPVVETLKIPTPPETTPKLNNKIEPTVLKAAEPKKPEPHKCDKDC